jgi:hypothetical protein
MVNQLSKNSAHSVQSSESIMLSIHENKDYIGGHLKFADLALLGPMVSAYKIVTIVRNPIDRFISEVNYHIKIIESGNELLAAHTPDWQELIIASYQKVLSIQKGRICEMDHLYDLMLSEYIANFLLFSSEIDEIKKLSIADAMQTVGKLLGRYAFIDSVETGGVESLLNFVCQDLSLDPALATPFRNESVAYAGINILSHKAINILKSSGVSNLLYLCIRGIDFNFHQINSWESMNDFAFNLYLSESKYASMKDDLEHLATSTRLSFRFSSN